MDMRRTDIRIRCAETICRYRKRVRDITIAGIQKEWQHG